MFIKLIAGEGEQLVNMSIISVDAVLQDGITGNWDEKPGEASMKRILTDRKR